MMIHVLDKTYQLKCDIPFNTLTDDQLHRELQYGSATYDFYLPSDFEDGFLIENEGYIVIPAPKPDEGFLEFVVKNVETKDDIKTVNTMLSATVDLNSDYVRPVTYTDKTAKEMTSDILAGSGWQPGFIDATGVQTLPINDYPSKLAGLLSVKDLFGLYIRFRVEYKGNQVTGRYVDMLSEIGRDTGKEFEYARDLVGLKRIQSTYETYGGVIGLGANDDKGNYLTFKDVSRSIASGDKFDKPIGQDYILHPDASNEFDAIGKYVNTDITDPGELADKSWEWLLDQISIKETYEADVALLASLIGYEHEAVGIGDTVGIKNMKFNPPLMLKAKIFDLTQSNVNPQNDKAVLGDYRRVFASPNALIKQLQSKLHYTTGVASGASTAAQAAQQAAANAQADADNANALLADISSDSKLTPSEKQTTKQEWDIIVAEKATIDGQADTYGITTEKTNYDNAYSALSGYITPLLADLTTTSNIVGVDFRANFKAYYDARTTLLRKITDSAKSYTDNQLTSYVDYVTYNDKVNSLQSQIDGNITSWFYDYDPTLSNAPASTWVTNTDKDNHLGDLFYNKSTGYGWRFTKDTTTGAYSWTSIKDTDVQKALSDAAAAQDTADSKRRVFISQPVPPYDIGDLWDNGGAVYRAKVSKASGSTYSLSDWYMIGDVTGSNTAKDTQNVNGTPADQMETQTGAQGKVDAVQVGGRNYVRNSDFSTGDSTNWNINGTVTIENVDGKEVAHVAGTSGGIYQTVLPEDGIYTVSFKAKGAVANSIARVGFLNAGQYINTPILSTTEWTKFTFTTNNIVLSDQGKPILHLYFTSGEYYITEVKVEKGNKATDWSPAPEDVQAGIDAAQQTASNAQTSADGKNTVFRQTTQPSTTGRKIGDLWFDSANGNRMSVWTGAWTLTKLDYQALSVGKLSAISADLGNMTAGDIKGVTINVGNGKFIVDANGNVYFSGELDGASGTFDGDLTSYQLFLGDDTTTIGEGSINFKINEDFNNDGVVNLFKILGMVVEHPDFNTAPTMFRIGLRDFHLDAQGYPIIDTTYSDIDELDLYAKMLSLTGDFKVGGKITKTSQAWTNMTLMNGCSNVYTTTAKARYMLNAMGEVKIMGRVKFASTPADGVIIANLPAECRPLEQVYPRIRNANLYIDTNGDVRLYAISNIGDVGLDGVSYDVINH